MSESPSRSGFVAVGRRAWAFVGMVLAAGIVYVASVALSGLVVPLVVASVMGILFVPVVDTAARYVPRGAAAGIVLVGLVVLSYWTIAIAVNGVIDQADEIGAQVEAGLAALAEWVGDLGLSIDDPVASVGQLEDLMGGLVSGLGSFLGGAFSSVSAFVVGTFVAIFFLYFFLADWKQLSGWVGNHLGVPGELGAGVVDDAVWSMRKYFYVLTASSLVSAVLIGVAMPILGLPLGFTVAIITFVTSYIPYLGAIFSGSFAFLIALGSGGLTDALIVLAVILIVQNVVSPILQTKYTRDALDLHPIVSFGSTMVGATFAGILGATLSSPLVAMISRINQRLADYETDPSHAQQ